MARIHFPSVKVQVKQEDRPASSSSSYTPVTVRHAAASSTAEVEPTAMPGLCSLDKGVITLLQEFVQTSKGVHIPHGMPALQWSYDTKILRTSKYRFRARLAFLLDGLPHHVLGSWGVSKKQSQREVAEGCLRFFIGAWSSTLLLSQEESEEEEASGSSATLKNPQEAPDLALGLYCQRSRLGSPAPTWSMDTEGPTGDGGSAYKAFVKLEVLGVPHTFAGRACRTPDAAKTDTAKRVLWYLQFPGYEDAYEVDRNAFAATDRLAAPSSSWHPWQAKTDSADHRAGPAQPSSLRK